MDNKIINCISTIDYFEENIFNKIGVGVEIQDFTEPSLLDEGWEQRVEEYKEKLKNFSNTVSLHAPFLDLKPTSPDKTIRKASIDRYLRTLNIAKRLNVEYIVFHSQINPWINNEPNMRKLNNSLSKEFWHKILEQIGEFKGTILIENIFEDNPMLLKQYVDEVNLPNVKVCLDIGHAKLKKDIDEWVKVLKDDIKYIHFHWNGGLYDEHLAPPDEKIVYLKRILEKYNINPCIALEYEVKDIQKEIKRYKIF